MPRILPVPDMNVYEYITEFRKSRGYVGQQNRIRVLRKRAGPPPPEFVPFVREQGQFTNKADFDAWATANFNDVLHELTPQNSPDLTNRSTMLPIAESKAMWGSPDTITGNGWVTHDSRMAGVIDHLFPTNELKQANLASGRIGVWTRTPYQAHTLHLAINKNDLQSRFWENYPQSFRITRFEYFDDTLGHTIYTYNFPPGEDTG